MSEQTLTVAWLVWPKWRALNFILHALAPNCEIDLKIHDKGFLRNYGSLKASGPYSELKRITDYLLNNGLEEAA